MIKVGSASGGEWLDAAQAAALLGVQKETIYVYASRGLLPGVRRGRGRIYKKSDVERHLLRARHKAGEVTAGALDYGAPLLESTITVLDPVRGPLYRGVAATELVATQSFEQVAERLWSSPSLSSRQRSWGALGARGFGVGPQALPTLVDAPPVSGLDALLFALAHRGRPVVADAEAERERARVLLRRAAAALALGRSSEAARSALQTDGIAAAALRALVASKRRFTESEIALVDSALVLIADHELTSSTFCARIAASTGAELASCLVAARATHSGPRHGGACDLIDELFADIERRGGGKRGARAAIADRFARGEKVPGFFRDLYPRGDPRAQALLAHPLVARHPMRERVQTLALAHAEVVEDEAPPSVDLALVAVAQTLALPLGSATALFALGRCAGWTAHVLEQRASAQVLRPRARTPDVR